MKRKMKKMKNVRKPWMLPGRQKHQTVSTQGVQVNSGQGEIQPPTSSPFLPSSLPAGLTGHLCLPHNNCLFSLILWNPWPCKQHPEYSLLLSSRLRPSHQKTAQRLFLLPKIKRAAFSSGPAAATPCLSPFGHCSSLKAGPSSSVSFFPACSCCH